MRRVPVIGTLQPFCFGIRERPRIWKCSALWYTSPRGFVTLCTNSLQKRRNPFKGRLHGRCEILTCKLPLSAGPCPQAGAIVNLRKGVAILKAALASCCAALVLILSGCAGSGMPRDHAAGYWRSHNDDDGYGPRTVSAVHGYVDSVPRTRRILDATAEALQLTPRQQVFWNNYQAKVIAFASDQNRVDWNTAEPQGALNGINARVNRASDRLAALQDIADAAKTLYQSLDSRQKAIADQRLTETIPSNSVRFADRDQSPRRHSRYRRGFGDGDGGFGRPSGNLSPDL